MVTLIKLALRREDDGTPIGQPAPCFFLCPCGSKIPARGRDGKPVGADLFGLHTCPGCGLRLDSDGYLVKPK